MACATRSRGLTCIFCIGCCGRASSAMGPWRHGGTAVSGTSAPRLKVAEEEEQIVDGDGAVMDAGAGAVVEIGGGRARLKG